MKFINPRNGIVIEMPEDWHGDNWEPVEDPAPAPKATPKSKPTEKPVPATKAPKASTAKKTKK